MTIGGADGIETRRVAETRRVQTPSDTRDLSGRPQSPAPRGFFVVGNPIVRPGTSAPPANSFRFHEPACTQTSND